MFQTIATKLATGLERLSAIRRARRFIRHEDGVTSIEFAIVATPFIVSDDYYMHNLNPLLSSYPGTDGVKIGYTEIAGRTVVASASRDGHRVYVSLMGSRNLGGDCIALFDWVWKTFRW